MFQGGVGGQNGVVWLDNRVGQRRRRVHAEFELGLLAIVGREALKDESTETGTSSTTERMEDEEALETRTVVREPANLVHDGVDHLLTHSVVTTGVCSYYQF